MLADLEHEILICVAMELQGRGGSQSLEDSILIWIYDLDFRVCLFFFFCFPFFFSFFFFVDKRLGLFYKGLCFLFLFLGVRVGI